MILIIIYSRGLAQTCPFPHMHNLISLGGPHQGLSHWNLRLIQFNYNFSYNSVLGFYQYPRCGEVYGPRCAKLQFYITSLAYRRLCFFNFYCFEYVEFFRPSQMHFTPATYFHDVNEEKYRKGSTFLAVINNENEINSEYVENLKSLKKFVLVMYEDDVGVVPKESTWFGYIDKDSNSIPLEELELYQQDRLGLKWMNENQQLFFLRSPLGHLKLNATWFVDNIVPLLKEMWAFQCSRAVTITQNNKQLQTMARLILKHSWIFVIFN